MEKDEKTGWLAGKKFERKKMVQIMEEVRMCQWETAWFSIRWSEFMNDDVHFEMFPWAPSWV